MNYKVKVLKVVTLPTGIICTHYKDGSIIVTEPKPQHNEFTKK